jgi:hypothetical protein
VPLSDEEARLLQQLEQSLAAEDPDFASTLRGSKFVARNRRIAALSGLGFVIGLAVMFSGTVSKTTWLGIVGFVAMLVCAYIFATAFKRGLSDSGQEVQSGPSGRGPSRGRPRSSGSFSDRMEERWQRRRDDNH